MGVGDRTHASREHLDNSARDNFSSEYAAQDRIATINKFFEQSDRCSRISTDLQTILPKLDLNSDGTLTKDELNRAVLNPSLKGRDAGLVVAMKRGFDTLSSLNPNDDKNRISMNDLKTLSEWKLLEKLDWSIEDTTTRSKTSNRQLYSSSDPLKSIVPEAVVQGGVPDCYFMAAMGSLAQLNPRAIADMIKDNGNGTYKVRLPGMNSTVIVSAPTDAELSLYANGGRYGTWPIILEKAYGKSLKNSGKEPFAERIGINQAEVGITALTGIKAERYSITGWPDKSVHNLLKGSIDRNKPSAAVIEHRETENGKLKISYHTHSILSHDAKRNEITLRNPWGYDDELDKKDSKRDGTYTIKMSEFTKKFHKIVQ